MFIAFDRLIFAITGRYLPDAASKKQPEKIAVSWKRHKKPLRNEQKKRCSFLNGF